MYVCMYVCVWYVYMVVYNSTIGFTHLYLRMVLQYLFGLWVKDLVPVELKHELYLMFSAQGWYYHIWNQHLRTSSLPPDCEAIVYSFNLLLRNSLKQLRILWTPMDSRAMWIHIVFCFHYCVFCLHADTICRSLVLGVSLATPYSMSSHSWSFHEIRSGILGGVWDNLGPYPADQA